MDEQEANAKLVLGTIYILLGMGLISMCINLMQEKIISQVNLHAPGPLDLCRYLVCRCVLRTFVWERGRGEGRRKIQRKNGGPSTLLKYVATVYFLILYLWQNLLPLTNGPKKKTEDGRTKDATYFLCISFYSCA
jgi:hypothetical protein